jgi:ankyrin repeat protein
MRSLEFLIAFPIRKEVAMCRLIRSMILLTAGLFAWNASYLRAEPIHDAARKGDVAEVKRLLGEDPKLVNLEQGRAKNNGVTPLHYAAQEGHKAVVQLLLASGAKINARGSYGTALELAVFNSHPDVANLLLDKRARLDIFTAAGLGKTKDIERLLRWYKPLINATDSDGQTALHWAAYTGQKAVVDLLLAKGAKVDPHATNSCRGRTGTPLHYAAWGGSKGAAELLLAHGADVSAHDDHEQTPLHEAAYNKKLAVAEVLIAHGADVNACGNRDGTCPIGRFQPNNYSHPNTPVPPSLTPLRLAVEQDSIDLVKLLIANKADVNAKEGDVTPLHITKNKAVAELLRAAGAKE